MRLTRGLLVLAAACFLITGCGDDEPSRPKGGSGAWTIANIWPNDDGRAWTYSYTLRTKGYWQPERRYATEEEVPPVPTLGEIAAILHSHPFGEAADTVLGTYALKFEGSITTWPGVTAQNLTETLDIPGLGPVAAQRTSFEEALLARLMTVRPDLRDKLSAYTGSSVVLQQTTGDRVRAGMNAMTTQLLRDPVLLHGGAWKKLSDRIGTYGDFDTLLAWEFVETPLMPGHEFTFQLVPSLASDVFEHCRYLAAFSVRTEAGLFRGALECLYVIDYGILSGRDEYGNFMGYSRVFDYGTVVYAPTVGPVYSYERGFVEPGDTLTTGWSELTLSLIGTGVLAY